MTQLCEKCGQPMAVQFGSQRTGKVEAEVVYCPSCLDREPRRTYSEQTMHRVGNVVQGSIARLAFDLQQIVYRLQDMANDMYKMCQDPDKHFAIDGEKVYKEVMDDIRENDAKNRIKMISMIRARCGFGLKVSSDYWNALYQKVLSEQNHDINGGT